MESNQRGWCGGGRGQEEAGGGTIQSWRGRGRGKRRRLATGFSVGLLARDGEREEMAAAGFSAGAGGVERRDDSGRLQCWRRRVE